MKEYYVFRMIKSTLYTENNVDLIEPNSAFSSLRPTSVTYLLEPSPFPLSIFRTLMYVSATLVAASHATITGCTAVIINKTCYILFTFLGVHPGVQEPPQSISGGSCSAGERRRGMSPGSESGACLAVCSKCWRRT